MEKQADSKKKMSMGMYIFIFLLFVIIFSMLHNSIWPEKKSSYYTGDFSHNGKQWTETDKIVFRRMMEGK